MDRHGARNWKLRERVRAFTALRRHLFRLHLCEREGRYAIRLYAGLHDSTLRKRRKLLERKLAV